MRLTSFVRRFNRMQDISNQEIVKYKFGCVKILTEPWTSIGSIAGGRIKDNERIPNCRSQVKKSKIYYLTN